MLIYGSAESLTEIETLLREAGLESERDKLMANSVDVGVFDILKIATGPGSANRASVSCLYRSEVWPAEDCRSVAGSRSRFVEKSRSRESTSFRD
jgi:hypothetical protein